MAVNPMQRKAHNSFLLGMLITLVVTGIIIVLLFMQISKIKKEKESMETARTTVYVLKTGVKSGNLITSDMLTSMKIDSNTIPSNAITAVQDLAAYSSCDENGNPITYAKDTEGNTVYTITISGLNDGNPILLLEDENLNQYYYETTDSATGVKNKNYIKFDSLPIIAKVDMEANTLITSSMLTKGTLLASDIRTQEYNMIILPTQLETGEFVDIRLRLPSGEDYIVVSHKQVTIPMIEGVDSASCIWIDLSEDEILNLSGAIVEAYQMNGSKLYATKYVEPGMQDAAQVTYIPDDAILTQILADNNVVEKAKTALRARITETSEITGTRVQDKTVIRNQINKAKNNEDAEDNLQDGVQSEITGLQEEREKYLESLGY